MSRAQLRVLTRVVGLVAFTVCFALVLEYSQGRTGAATPADPPRSAPAADASVVVPAVLAGPRAAAAAGSDVSFAGLPSVGVLIGAPGSTGPDSHHFCTASVVDSPGGDVVATAAHCVVQPGSGSAAPGPVVFLPGYHDQQKPYGEWASSRILVDPRWVADGNPDYDIAFLVVHREDDPSARLSDLVGAEQIEFGARLPQPVGVIGYPTAAERPVACHNTLKPYSDTQSEFDCPGFADGSSGGPMLTGIDPRTGRGTLVGVIGGYEQGGYSDSVSYASAFTPAVKALYQQATTPG
ncbi:trypsin-like serine peptidase [Streptacidiphilus carbonis]|uniref:trypsin-like serine peptidase n=1 Tax=Streptacidiphilus carbonis TaxID=105422 RepID=UPI000A4CE729|nr:trypsin-like serine protease [Streptacidiphilus carbonis]